MPGSIFRRIFRYNERIGGCRNRSYNISTFHFLDAEPGFNRADEFINAAELGFKLCVVDAVGGALPLFVGLAVARRIFAEFDPLLSFRGDAFFYLRREVAVVGREFGH